MYQCDNVNSILIGDSQTDKMKKYDLRKKTDIHNLTISPDPDKSSFSFIGCFIKQLEKFCENASNHEYYTENLEMAKRGIEVIETCYRNRKFIGMPWLPEQENGRAFQLHQM